MIFTRAFFAGDLFFDGYYPMFNMRINEVSVKIPDHISAFLKLSTCVNGLFSIPFIGARALTWYLQTTDSKVRVDSNV